MAHNFSRFYKCPNCERLYFTDYWANPDKIKLLYTIYKKDWGTLVEPYLPKCQCGSKIKAYYNNCPKCGNTYKNKIITYFQDRHENIYIPTIFKNKKYIGYTKKESKLLDFINQTSGKRRAYNVVIDKFPDTSLLENLVKKGIIIIETKKQKKYVCLKK